MKGSGAIEQDVVTTLVGASEQMAKARKGAPVSAGQSECRQRPACRSGLSSPIGAVNTIDPVHGRGRARPRHLRHASIR